MSGGKRNRSGPKKIYGAKGYEAELTYIQSENSICMHIIIMDMSIINYHGCVNMSVSEGAIEVELSGTELD